jgi:hypothetical protein
MILLPASAPGAVLAGVNEGSAGDTLSIDKPTNLSQRRSSSKTRRRAAISSALGGRLEGWGPVTGESGSVALCIIAPLNHLGARARSTATRVSADHQMLGRTERLPARSAIAILAPATGIELGEAVRQTHVLCVDCFAGFP